MPENHYSRSDEKGNCIAENRILVPPDSSNLLLIRLSQTN